MKEIRIWFFYTINSFQQTLSNRFITGVFIFAKSLRIGLFLVFLHFIFQGTTDLAGFSRNQIIFFYLSFNLIDTLSQLLFRQVYHFRSYLITGNLDFVLTKPVHPLLKLLLGGADVLDLIMCIVLVIITVWFGVAYITTDWIAWLGFLALVVNGLLVSAGFHISVLAFSVVTITVDHLIMIYRDLTSLLRIPIDVYIEPLRSILTFIIPLGIMITFPAKLLMGLLSWQMLTLSIILSITYFSLSIVAWNWSLRHYQSASS